MKTQSPTLFKKIETLKKDFISRRKPATKQQEQKFPERSELFSSFQMQQHGGVLARAHQLCNGHQSDQLLSRLADNERVIIHTCNQLTASIKEGNQVTPAAVWLLDNFYLIEEQIRTAKHHLPKNYSRELPRLLQGTEAGRPRVYDIALEVIAHGDGRIDPENLSSFVTSYQQVTPLKLGELWAIPIMMRLALIENMRRVAERLNLDRINRNLAENWAEQMIDTVIKNPNKLILLVADMARSNPPIESSFVAELVRRLQGESPALTLPLTWLSQRLAETGQNIDNIVQLESQKQAGDQVSISNSINSLRFLGTMDWQEFVESMSGVNQLLLEDPTGIFGSMDFATRDQYRHAIETIAKHSARTELDVTNHALQLAKNQQAAPTGSFERRSHVGYYLINKGVAELERALGMPNTIGKRLLSTCSENPLLLYLGSITLLTLLATWGVIAMAHRQGLHDGYLIFCTVLCLIATSQFSQSIVNWISTFLTRPKLLPRMDYATGIPEQFRTLVVVPSMLFSRQNIDRLVESLEVRFLANHDNNLRFCLLTDFTDAETETTPEDLALLSHAQQSMTELNARYLHFGASYFLLFHRPRTWNAHDKVWMGHERKRGKLTDLNNLLRNGVTSAFSMIVGDISQFTVKYVITLDSDTELPRDSARKFVATMSHPLNQPNFAPDRTIITDGYGVLQPRVVVCLPGTDASLYELLCGGESGIDPYTRTVSDVYQDVFGEGSFIGKGIYDVDVFARILDDHMPDNRILSHDLLEGCYIRAGLLSDIQLYEQYPATYASDMQRRQRWIRGDWQIASWVLPRVPANKGTKITSPNRRPNPGKNPLSGLSRWKILDNLRRSVLPLSLTLLLILGWIGTSAGWLWTGVALSIYFLPVVFNLLVKFLQKPDSVTVAQHITELLRSASTHGAHIAMTLAFLPFEAWVNVHAIVLTHWRLIVTHRGLLEWQASGIALRTREHDCTSYYRLMWIAPLVALVTAIFLDIAHPTTLIFASPLLILWWIAPLIAYLVSKPVQRHLADLNAQQIVYLKKMSRKIWLFFESHVGPADNWLPPDNVQEKPIFIVAHRTSPTNIGLLLTTNFGAFDFGYLAMGNLLSRTQATLSTMEKLERYQGHFFNWYSTQSLTPLEPRYVSSVDSGNLAGHLLTVRAGLFALIHRPLYSTQLFHGIKDTYAMLGHVPTASSGAPLHAAHAKFAQALDSACKLTKQEPLEQYAHLLQLNTLAAEFPNTGELLHNASSIANWTERVVVQCRDALDEFNQFMPWLATLHGGSEQHKLNQLMQIQTLRQLVLIHSDGDLEEICSELDGDRGKLLFGAVQKSIVLAKERIVLINEMIEQCTDYAQSDYHFLYNPITHLLAIGYNVTERRRDSGYYDLLASEARLTTFVGIAQGQLPQESWFALGRQLTIADGNPILLSWSGSMFEYLMPLLIMPTFNHTLLDQTYHSSVERQIDYGLYRGKLWGISESGYNNFDANLNYQYRAFGVPGLGFKRGLGDDLVIAPYASFMALMIMPNLACENLMTLSADGYEGSYGLFEAIDFTPSRLARGQNRAVISSFMAHHQAMSFLAIAYILLDRPMQKRFESDPLFQATMPLLLERVPKATSTYSNTTELADIRTMSDDQKLQTRILFSPDSSIPDIQLLSNGRYHVMVTNGGGSYSQWNNLSITRWREDTTRDNWGTFCFIRNLDDGTFFSTGFQPTLVPTKNYEVIFSEGRVEFRRSDNNFDIHTEIVVSPEDDVELRRTTIINCSRSTRRIDITSYAEVVLAPANADAMHPAFSNLFVQTEIIEASNAILCTRRPNSAEINNPWMFHILTAHGANVERISYETDRLEFIGRGNTIASPRAMSNTGPLAGNQGSVLDPIVAIRYEITLLAEQTLTIDMVTGIAASRAQCLELVNKFQDRHLASRVIELAWTHSQVVLRQLNASEADAQLYNRLASSIIYVNPQMRADASVLIRNHRGQSGLWSYTISGDLPIVLVQIKSINNIALVHQLVQAHSYWSARGLAVDLVIWNEDHAVYRQSLQDQIIGLVSSAACRVSADRPGGIFARIADQITLEDRILFHSVARIILTDSAGTLIEQINRRDIPKIYPSRLIGTSNNFAVVTTAVPKSEHALLLANDYGGFSADGREYVIRLGANQHTPAPWSNVIANAQFGTVISENGMAYTWAENAHEFRLTPWANDPVCDSSGETMYIRDDETGKYWSPTPLPCRGKGDYVVRHGFGYSVFEHIEDGLHSVLTIYVALDESVKYSVLELHNLSGYARSLSVIGYTEWVLGDTRSRSAMHICTTLDPASGAILARNPYNTEFVDRVAFYQANTKAYTVTGDRNEFIGRNRSLQNPAAMDRTRLSGKTGASLDPCGAIQVPLTLARGERRQIIFTLGIVNSNVANPSEFIQRAATSSKAFLALEQVKAYWKLSLSTISVNTPDLGLNFMANGWLMYQTLACRMWARSGYYQSGGAFGFRDQLQDAMALVHTEPQLVRNHLLLCASHQFLEGDVQHWWHPPGIRGVRTKCSDDYLWLPLATLRYIHCNADWGVLDEVAPFLEGRALNADESSYYDTPTVSLQRATLYAHCKLAIEHGLTFGTHGLSLIGSCDWNDGMDKVGELGKGESVWLSFFLYNILTQFSDLAGQRNDIAFATRCHDEAAKLKTNINQNGWDGAWFRRAYFDDGTPLGSSQNTECQIDSLSQSWSVLSGAGEKERTVAAMQSVWQRLVRPKDDIVILLTPPFDKSDQNPGYIRGYVPGVRENGGQYTHAAIWAAMAYAQMGEHDNAWELMRMINPVNHAKDAAGTAIYKVEPYVIAADVYAVEPHTGQGGWTWYTGSAGWMYRFIVESLLGIQRQGNQLSIRPCPNKEWSSYSVSYRFYSTNYVIAIHQSTTLPDHIELDGLAQQDRTITMIDDQLEHSVEVTINIGQV